MSSVFAFIRRHKGKIVVAGAALGAAAYYVHQQLEDRRLTTLQEAVQETALGRDARQAYVLESQQRTADETITSLMSAVWMRLGERFDVEGIVRVIQQSNDMSTEEKSRHFERMLVGALSRAIVASYALTAVCLTLKIQVSMVAGQTFAERSTSDSNTNAQHAFLQCSHYFVTQSLNTLCDEVESICREAIQSWPITSVMTADELSALLYNIRRNVHFNIADVMAPISNGDAQLASLLSTLRVHVEEDDSVMWVKEQVSYSIARFIDTVHKQMGDEARVIKIIPHLTRQFATLTDTEEYEAPLSHALASAPLSDIARRVFDATVGTANVIQL